MPIVEGTMSRTLEQAEVKLRAQRLKTREERERKRKTDNRRKYAVGDLVITVFPELLTVTPGTKAENEIRFQFFRLFLEELKKDSKLMQDLKDRAAHRAAFEGEMDGSAEVQIRQCVSGHEVLSEDGGAV